MAELLQQKHEMWRNVMTRYNIKEAERVLENHRNNAIWNAIAQYAEGFVLVPTMKSLD